jgi:hypothetical protein
MAQPNLPAIAGHLQGLSAQLPALANLPVIQVNQQQQQFQAQTTQALQQLQQAQAQTTQALQQLQQDQAQTTQVLQQLQQDQAQTTQALAQMQQAQAQMQRAQAQTTQVLQQLQQAQAQTTQALQQLQGLSRRSFNTAAKAANAHARGADRLVPLLDNNGIEPPGFPHTKSSINRLAAAELTPLLATYGLATNGTVATRRERLATHIGCQ